jgi:hypothetical protein
MESLAIHPPFELPASRPVVFRFLWKECRVLRGLAIGVVALALAEMAASTILVASPTRPAWMLISAFGATALFVIGATVVLFAAERDEGTTALLQLLPQNRAAALAGKLLAAIGMTAAVLLVLCVAAVAIAGWRFPDAHSTRLILSQGYVALAEAFAWGLLVSLLCPNGLLAATLGVAAASFSSQIAIALTVTDGRGFSIDDFQSAIPGRLAIVAAVLAVDVWLGLRWFAPPLAPTLRIRRSNALPTTADQVVAKAAAGPRRLSMFGRLVWQSFRQSWKTVLAAIVIGAFLMFSVEAIFDLFLRASHIGIPRLPLSLLFLPALFGALVFRGDQRSRQYRFLAEHAARPRTVWLARQLAWLLPVVLLCLAAHAVGWMYIGRDLYDSLRQGGDTYYAALYQSQKDSVILLAVFVALQAALVSWCAALAAYGVGQLFSLVLRSDVLAALLSLGASVLILLWAYVLWAWQLSPILFLLPLAVGALLATWLRVKNWMFDRQGVRHWAVPVAALVLPIALMFLYVPVARLLQLNQPYPAANFDSSSIKTYADEAAKTLALGRDVADDYARLTGRMDEIAQRNSALSDEDLRSFRHISSPELDEEILKLSRVPCRLPFTVVESDGPGTRRSPPPATTWSRVESIANYAILRAEFLQGTDLDAALELFMAARRINAQRARGEIFSRDWWVSQNPPSELSEPMLVDWATSPGQTPERVQRAIEQLREIDRGCPTPTTIVMNHYLKAKSVVRGASSPSFNQQKSYESLKWLAYLAHNFPGEAARGEKALGVFAAAAIDFALTASSHMDSLPPRQASQWREFLRHTPDWGIDVDSPRATIAMYQFTQDWNTRLRFLNQTRLFSAAKTSYLSANEFWIENRMRAVVADWVADVARRRAEMVRLALIAYHLENGAYPDSLDALAPKYLALYELRDPYASGPFGYEHKGFPLWFAPWEFRSIKPLPPNTPLIWSTGDSAAQPTEIDAWVQDDVEGNPIRVFNDPDREGHDEIRPLRVMSMYSNLRDWGPTTFWLALPTKFP